MKVGVVKTEGDTFKKDDVERKGKDGGEEKLVLKVEAGQPPGQDQPNGPPSTNSGEEMVAVTSETAEGVDSSRPSTGGDSVVVDVNPLYENKGFRIFRTFMVSGIVACVCVVIGFVMYYNFF